jgi:hypothetical protein
LGFLFGVGSGTSTWPVLVAAVRSDGAVPLLKSITAPCWAALALPVKKTKLKVNKNFNRALKKKAPLTRGFLFSR